MSSTLAPRRGRPRVRRRIMPSTHPLVHAIGRRYAALVMLRVLWWLAEPEDFAVLRAATDLLLASADRRPPRSGHDAGTGA